MALLIPSGRRTAIKKTLAALSRLVLSAGLLLIFAEAAQAQGTAADYKRAEMFQNMGSLVSRLSLTPNWIGSTDRFWYLDRHSGVKTFMLVDPDLGSQAPAFDHSRLADGLSKAAGQTYKTDALPFDHFSYRESGRAIAFEVRQKGWWCELAGYTCREGASPRRRGEIVSPDERWAVFLRDHNIWVRDLSTDAVRPLTQDGSELRTYAPTDLGLVTAAIRKSALPAALFSPDSRRILALRTDRSKVRSLTVIESPAGAPPRSHSFHNAMPGDARVPQAEGVIIELASGAVTPIKLPPITRLAWTDALMCWDPSSATACFTEAERGYRTVKLHLVDAVNGKVNTTVVERSDTYVFWEFPEIINRGRDLFWLSERSGWSHVYRLNGRTGGVRKPLTSGNWSVREILHVQEPKKTVFFVASGREQDQDPYNRHLYRVGFDGTRLKRLTPESGDHNISVSPTGRYFVDTYSRIDSPPITVLRAADGRLVRVLQRGDISRVVAAGWRVPEPFKAKAADGKTDIYGAIYRPSNFDPSRKYPVLDGIYPGPQVIQTPKAFEVPPAHKNHQAFAELGFIVVVVDGRGGPLRSRAFREASYGQMGSAGGLDDHIAALRQLAKKYPQFDIDRVGIYGHSGGGYAAARALLLYPDFYKVAVASSGNHDLRSYSAHFIERFQGYPVDVAQYAAQSNPPLAHRLKGKLLLIHGDLDDNVHVSNTLQMADALIAARKDFDLLIMPNRNHAFADLAKGADGSSATDPYFIRRRWDFFVRHLLGVTPPAETQ